MTQHEQAYNAVMAMDGQAIEAFHRALLADDAALRQQIAECEAYTKQRKIVDVGETE